MESVYDENCYGKCGEVFLTVEGNIAFLCTLCENKYRGFQEYKDHILEIHYVPFFNEELSGSESKEDSSFHTYSDEDYLTEDFDLFVEEEKEIELNPTENEIFVVDQSEISKYEPGIDNQMVEESNKDLLTENEIILSNPVEVSNYETVNAVVEVSGKVTPHRNSPQSVESNSVELLKTKTSLFNKEVIRNLTRTRSLNPSITDRKYKCPHCGFSGADRANMKKHIQRHSTNKPHHCTECPKAFYTRTELKIHIRIHTGERPYLCTLCGQAFSSSGKLSSHQKRHYNIRDKECPVCKMRFFGTYPLRSHMAVHSEKRDFKCEQCDASFKLPSGLKAHMKLHENKREYQCKLCDSRFNQNAGLYSHMKTCHSIVLDSSKELNKTELD